MGIQLSKKGNFVKYGQGNSGKVRECLVALMENPTEFGFIPTKGENATLKKGIFDFIKVF